MILGTAGHVDHGKTALIRALTGVDTDRLPEERRRGITIELGFAPLLLDGVGTVGVIDVPGHESFVRTMVAGASGIQVALLVVAADEGVMPQTREHLAILRLLGVPGLVVALTKSDLVDAEWLALADDEIRTVISESHGLEPEIIAVSAQTGDGLDLLRSALARAFSEARPAPVADLFRMPVDRAFTVQGTGTVITGSIWSGAVDVGDTVTIFPSGEAARVRAIQQHGDATARASAGSRAALALAGIPLSRVARGCTVVAGDGWAPTHSLGADVTLIHGAPQPGHGTRLRLHLGASNVECRLVLAHAGSPGARSRASARVVLRDPTIARAGDHFVLRLASPAETIGGGIVTDPYAERGRRRAPASSSAGPAKNLAAMLSQAGVAGLQRATLSVRLGVAPESVTALELQVGAVRAGDRIHSPEIIAALAGRVRAMVAAFHASEPLSAGIPLQQLRATAGVPAPLLALALRERGEPQLQVLDGLVAIAEWRPDLGVADSALLRDLLHDICSARLEPRDVAELTASFGDGVPALLRFSERNGALVRVEPDRYYSSEAIADLERRLRRGMSPGKAYSPSQLRVLVGVSRKYLIPLLEFCDRVGITDRSATGRVLME